MGDLVLKGATSGQITLTPTGIAGTNTLTLPATTGNIITSADNGTVTQTMIQNGSSGTPLPGIGATGPAFSAYQSTKQTSITASTWTKVVFQTEEFDTNNNFDSATNYRFTPTVAGYYQFTGGVAVATTGCPIAITLYRDGTAYKTLFNAASNMFCVYGTALVYMNGSTNYAELYCFLGTGQQLDNSALNTYFSAALVRAA
jgi:hypothetical protein